MVVTPRGLRKLRRRVGHPYLPVGRRGQRGDVLHDARHLVGCMVQQKLAPFDVGPLEEFLRHALRDDRHRQSGIERCLVVGLSRDEREVEHAPEDIVRLHQVDAHGGLAGEVNRCGNDDRRVDGDSFRRRQRLEAFACGRHTHRAVAASVAPGRIGDTHVVYVQETVAVALRSKRRHFHLLHHHHQHDKKDGECRTGYAYGTDQRLLPQLCPSLIEILSDHIRYLFNNKIIPHAALLPALSASPGVPGRRFPSSPSARSAAMRPTNRAGSAARPTSPAT